MESRPSGADSESYLQGKGLNGTGVEKKGAWNTPGQSNPAKNGKGVEIRLKVGGKHH
jgi:hypothetical protein